MERRRRRGKKKGTQGKQLQSPQGCQPQSPPPQTPTSGVFKTRQTEGKLLPSEDFGVSSSPPPPIPLVLPGHPSHSKRSLHSQRVSKRCGLLPALQVSTSIHLLAFNIFKFGKTCHFQMEIFCWRYLHLLLENTKQRTTAGGFFFPPSLSTSQSRSCVYVCECVCVVFTNSIKIHEISSQALFGPGKVRPASFQIS